jgi:cyclomaltodextrinase
VNAEQEIINTATALQQRETDPIHTPPPATPKATRVVLRLERADLQPEVVARDIRREFVWRIGMTQMDDGAWEATMLLPSQPTVVHYHFEFSDGTAFYALRQVEGLIEGTHHPRYGEWTRRPFQITAYDPESVPPTWTHGQTIYQIFPDRFAKGELRADIRPRVAKNVHGNEPLYLNWGDLPENPPQGRDFYGGNLRGIIDKLDYLHDLGVTCLYLTPIFESPSNHRYDAMDYFAIDPMLGTEADLVELVEGVHTRGMRIILDGVFNHCSNDSKYFNMRGFYGEDVGAARNQQSPYYRMFEFVNWPDEYVGWVGVQNMPEFVECPEHEEFFLDAENGVANYWLTKTGMDGWRTDVTPWVSDEFWRRFRRAVRKTNPEAYLIAEDWNDASNYFVGDMFDATMNYRFANAVKGFLAVDAINVFEFEERLANWLRDTPAPYQHSQMNLVDSHDTARVFTVCGEDKQRFKQIIAFQNTYLGSPMICYGDEVGLTGDFAETSRQSFRWEDGDTELQDFYRQILNFRKHSQALRVGSVETIITDEAQRSYGFVRRAEGETVYAIFNGSDETVNLTLTDVEAGTWFDVTGQNAEIVAHGGDVSVTLTARGVAIYAKR